MKESIRYLVAISGAEALELVDFVKRLAGSGSIGPEIQLIHVVDSGAHALAAQDPPLRRSLWPGAAHRMTENRLEEADAAGSTALLASWRERLEAAMPDATVTTEIRHGRPEQEVVAAATQAGANVIVVCARAGTGPTEPGPHSVGHVARFVLDHAPVPVLLVRGGF